MNTLMNIFQELEDFRAVVHAKGRAHLRLPRGGACGRTGGQSLGVESLI